MIRLILPEHLSPELLGNENVILESYPELSYYKHHKKKLVFFISAMRHFYENHKNKLKYVKTDDTLEEFLAKNKISECYEPGDYRTLEILNRAGVKILPDPRFMCKIEDFKAWAKGRKTLLMDIFYRDMRRKTGLLMNGADPVGGKWNFDADNRQAFDGRAKPRAIPEPKLNEITKDVIGLVEKKFGDHFGDIHPFWIGVTQEDAEAQCEEFMDKYLDNFGLYQDAMEYGVAFMFHSVVAQYLNLGLLDPRKVCEQAEQRYKKGARLESVEGFIRQILGWREFIRGVYWLKMPEYLEMNHLEHKLDLPDFYWTGETKMACMRHCVTQTKEQAYSHHIQRLMITGNFATLIGVDPKQLHEWYMIVYADAHEWVEVPNTIGMASYADGGIVGTKPYVASANYINKMSNFCQKCEYDCKKKDGPNACPFNYLYWNFLMKHEAKLKNNPRIGMAYVSLGKMSKEVKENYKNQSNSFINSLKGYKK